MPRSEMMTHCRLTLQGRRLRSGQNRRCHPHALLQTREPKWLLAPNTGKPLCALPSCRNEEVADVRNPAPECLTESDMGSPLASMSMASAAILALMSSLVDSRFFFFGSAWTASPLPSVCNTAAQLMSVWLVAACCSKEEAWHDGQVMGVHQHMNTRDHVLCFE